MGEAGNASVKARSPTDSPQLPGAATIPSTAKSKSPSAGDSIVPSPPQAAKSVSNLERFRILLLQVIRRLAQSADRFLVRLTTVLSKPQGVDAFLGTVEYTLGLIIALSRMVLEERRTHTTADMAEKVDSVLFPRERLVATILVPLTHLVTGGGKLLELVADYRIFARLFGLTGLYAWGRELYHSPAAVGKQEISIKGIIWSEIAALVLFQGLENVAYLAGKGVLTGEKWLGEEGKRKEIVVLTWSLRFWCLQIVLEVVRLMIEWRMKHEVVNSNTSKEDKEEKESIKNINEGNNDKEKPKMDFHSMKPEKQNWLWWRDFSSNLGYYPLALHYSLGGTLLNETALAVSGMIGSGALLAHAWIETE